MGWNIGKGKWREMGCIEIERRKKCGEMGCIEIERRKKCGEMG